MKLKEIGEDAVVDAITRELRFDERVEIGPGDDCALVRFGQSLQLLKTDCVVEGIHFLPETPARAVGWKALCRAISDIAAMGGEPLDAVITVAIPPDRELAWLTDLYGGLNQAAARYRVNLVGGETSRSPGPVFVSVALTGKVEKERLVTRGGGKVGDRLYVTGKLGGSLQGKNLSFEPRLEESRWLTQNFKLHAMIDLSDGLGSDLPRLAEASGAGFEINLSALPRNEGCSKEQAISDGEDYELLFAVSDEDGAKLESDWKKAFPDLPLTRIGRLTERKGDSLKKPGYDHFR
ncbi:MAG: thiamine-monophosphate kinase [Verrucomicrobia bacterium]|nr:thiamine-monophosphate kinase [Verrucomicrobiota bacterium]